MTAWSLKDKLREHILSNHLTELLHQALCSTKETTQQKGLQMLRYIQMETKHGTRPFLNESYKKEMTH